MFNTLSCLIICVFEIILFSFINDLQGQIVYDNYYNELYFHTKTTRTIASAVQIDSFEYDQVGAITRHLRWTEAPDLVIDGVEYNNASYGPNTLPLYHNVSGLLEINHSNIGNRPTNTFGIEVRWSPDTLWDNGNDTFLYDVAVNSLVVGASRTEPNNNFFLGTNIPVGNGYLLFYTDNEQDILELNDSNNLFIVPIYICTPYTLSSSGVDDYCSMAQGTATTNASGGTSPYNYVWSQGTSANSVNGLQGSLGGQVYTVTATDANGCTASDQVTIQSNPPLSMQTLAVSPALCGSTTGQISVSAQGGSGNVNYTWSNGQNTATGYIGGLIAGVVSVTATDGNGCTASLVNTIPGNTSITIGSTVTDATCSQSNGSISINPTGGIGTYTTSWNTGNTGNTLSNLAVGNYTVTVNDGTCSSVETFTVNDLAAPMLTTTIIDASCGQMDGQITASAVGGTGTINYLWSTGQTSDSLVNIGAGFYALTITDANGCTTTNTTTVGTNNTLIVQTAIFDDSCNLATGRMQVQPLGGSGNYSYTWSGNGSTTASASGLSQGIYTVTITDNAAPQVCVLVHTDTIQATTAIALTIQAIAADTCAYGNASVLMSAFGDTSTMIFTWDNGANTLSIDSLSAGTYSLTAIDVNGCTATQSVTIPSVSFTPNIASYLPIIDSISCIMKVGVTGNALFLPYTYLWSTGATTDTIHGLPDSLYSVMVTNSLGCDTILSFNCTPIDVITLPNDVSIEVFPNPNSGDQFSVKINGGKIQSYAIYDAIGQRLVWEAISIPSGTSFLLPQKVSVAASYVFVFDVLHKGKNYAISKRVIKSKE
ncbi:SprB repeat-containing protein [Aureispira anguillae]|uniref:SprB repeat-containing protein n=1 Tax=Aureispira anguillae TaxID=2864201 RepID=A0A916DXB9_9BACT|nr:SprB repeat-containing protein [Aureispira anguillae]BDS15702.1 SprB repeat-containing protein [Aureispira anguillae]